MISSTLLMLFAAFFLDCEGLMGKRTMTVTEGKMKRAVCFLKLPPLLMLMPMVNIREVWMGMFMRLVPIAMLSAGGMKTTVRVPAMFVVRIPVSMFCCIMGVWMLVSFGKMQPDAKHHQGTGNHKGECYGLSRRDCQYRAKKWRYRKISAGSRCAEMAQADDKQG